MATLEAAEPGYNQGVLDRHCLGVGVSAACVYWLSCFCRHHCLLAGAKEFSPSHRSVSRGGHWRAILVRRPGRRLRPLVRATALVARVPAESLRAHGFADSFGDGLVEPGTAEL